MNPVQPLIIIIILMMIIIIVLVIIRQVNETHQAHLPCVSDMMGHKQMWMCCV